ncbi:MAG: right-handed parallel beta-helix repeat-containing protein [Bacteroidia bacterium]|nr:right-handed parallel beta-helix repeat-containing protein [Bacteroidia bacterium]
MREFEGFYKGVAYCAGMMWQGIEVWGKYNSTSATYTGKLILNNSTIRFAHNAVILGKTKLVQVTGGFQYNGHVLENGGGILQATNTQFINNATNIRIWDCTVSNTCTLEGCTFSCDPSLRDPYYNSANPINYSTTSMKLHNPFFPDANALCRSSYGIIAYKKKPYIEVIGCTFDNLQFGILAYDSKIIVKDNQFSNLRAGVHVDNSVASFSYSSDIENNEFEDMTHRGIGIIDGKGDIIKNNNFQKSEVALAEYPYGIYIIRATGFDIKDNTFNKLRCGVYLNTLSTLGIGNSGTIGFEAGGNIFTSCYQGINAQQKNPGVKIKCNNFIPFAPYDKNLRVSGTAFPQQGEQVLYNHHKPAGNEFINPDKKQIYSQNISFMYVHHHSPLSTKPTPDGILTEQDNLFDNQSTKDYTVGSGSCYPETGHPPISYQALLSDISDNILTLKQELSEVEANLDNGNTTGLINAINSNMPAGQLKNMMLSHSPLSDQVIIPFINRQKPTPPGIFKEVMTPNLPVSDNVKQELDIKLAELPKGIAKQIQELQLFNPAYRTPTTISREIQYFEVERSNLLNEAVNHWFKSDSVETAVQFLEQENSLQSAEILFGHYLTQGNVTKTEEKLNILADAGWDEDFIKLAELRMALITDSLTIFDLTPQQDSMVWNIAYNCSSLASTMAQAILGILYNIQLDDYCEQSLSLPKSLNIPVNKTQNESQKQANNYLFGSSANPVKENAVIWYQLPENCTDARLDIFDNTGRKINSYRLSEQENSLEIDFKNLDNGIYFYRLVLDDKPVETKRLIVIK